MNEELTRVVCPVVYDTVQYLASLLQVVMMRSLAAAECMWDFGTFVSCMHRYCAYWKSSSLSRDIHRCIHTY
jgi:hypothetical protein